MYCEAGNVVAAAAYGNSHTVIARDLQCELNVLGVRAARDSAGSAIDRGVPDAAQLIEFSGVGTECAAAQSRLERLRNGHGVSHGDAVRRIGSPYRFRKCFESRNIIHGEPSRRTPRDGFGLRINPP